MLTVVLYIQVLAATALFALLAPTRRIYRGLLALEGLLALDAVLGAPGREWVFTHGRLLLLIGVFAAGGLSMITRRCPSLVALPAMALGIAGVTLVRWDMYLVMIGRFHLEVLPALARLTGELFMTAVLVSLAVAALAALVRGSRPEPGLQGLAILASLLLAALYGPSLVAPVTRHWYYSGGLESVWILAGRFREDMVRILDVVVRDGAFMLHKAAVTFIFGAMLAAFLARSGVARTMIRGMAELGGDSPRRTAVGLFLVTAVLFQSLGGLGAIMMVGSIVLPLLLALDVAPEAAAGLLLMGISTGGILNAQNWVLYTETLGMPRADVAAFALPLAGLAILVGLVYILREFPASPDPWLWGWSASSTPARVELDLEPIPVRHRLARFHPGRLATVLVAPNAEGVRPVAVGIPALPLILIIAGGVDPVPAFAGALLLGVALQATRRRLDLLVGSMVDSVASVAPALIILMGLGMLIKALWSPSATSTGPAAMEVLAPLVRAWTPAHPVTFVIAFGLAAPLALYRGPLNIWGMGFGLAQLLHGAALLNPALIMAALLSVGQVQGISDPTNTHNIWVGSFTRVSTVRILGATLAYALALAVLGLILAAWRYRDAFGG